MSTHEMFYTQLSLELHRAGYYKGAVAPDDKSYIPLPQYPNLRITRGGVFYGTEHTQDERDLAHGDMHDIQFRALDACKAWERSREFPARVHAGENFRLVDEYADTVMAVRNDGPRGLHFVTWDYDFERTGMNHGHYTTSYEGAKEDFAVRAGLVDEHRYVTPEEASILYRGLKFMDGEDIGLDMEDEKLLDALYQKFGIFQREPIQHQDIGQDNPDSSCLHEPTMGM